MRQSASAYRLQPRLVWILASCLAASAGCFGFLRGYTAARSAELAPALVRASSDPVEQGAVRFVYGDLGGLSTDALETNAVPWKLLMASLAMSRADAERRPLSPALLDGILAPYGFVVPDSIANWPSHAPDAAPRFTRPIGMVTGQLRRSVPHVNVEVGNLACSSCHAGVIYTPDGTPTRHVWLGLPNTSLDLQSFVTASYQSLKRALANEPALLAAIDTLYPNLPRDERSTLRSFVIPRARERIARLAATIDAPVPFSNGSAGLTNGAAAIKYQLGLIPRDRPANEFAFVSIPDFSSRPLRSSLLVDGTYTASGTTRFQPLTPADVTPAHLNDLARVVALFTVPVMGVHIDRAAQAYADVTRIMRFIAWYTPPPFPGSIDTVQARAGRAVYGSHCASCHGDVNDGGALTQVHLVRFPNRLVPQSTIGTDSTRWTTITPATAHALQNGPYGRYVDAARTGGYVAPPLTGLWATAPYLHNGSVPTVWHLLHPDQRPTRFLLGGHRLDFARLGVALEQPGDDGVARYPAGYMPWTPPHVYDTREPGRGNGGHTRQVASLTETEKSALLEYLKLF